MQTPDEHRGRDSKEDLAGDLAWLRDFTPATRRAASLPALAGERMLVVCHLDAKMVPYFDALVGAGAEVWACAANPATTRDAVMVHLEDAGVRVPAREGDPPERHAAHLRTTISAGPTLLSEMAPTPPPRQGDGCGEYAVAWRLRVRA